MNKHLFRLTILIFVLGFSSAKAQSYDTLWNRFYHCDHYRIADANRLLDSVEWKAQAENNEYQLLKVCLLRVGLYDRYGNWTTKQTAVYVDSIRKMRGYLYQPVYDYALGTLLRRAITYNYKRSSATHTDYHLLDEWSREELTAAAEACFQRAMDNCEHLLDFPIADYPFIISDQWEQMPQLCPTLFDLLVQSRIHLLENYLAATPMAVPQLYDKAIRMHQSPQDDKIRLSYELQRLRYFYDSKQLDTTAYEMALHKLEQRYGSTNEAILYAWALYYYELNGTLFYHKAISYFNALIQHSSDEYYVHNAQHYKEEIERKWLYVHGSQSDFYPNHHIPLCVAYRNVDSVYVSIYRTPQPLTIPFVSTKEMPASHLSREDAASLTKCVAKQLLLLPLENPYDYHATDVWLDSLPVGSYVLLFHLEPKWDTTTVLMTKTIQVTNVQLTGWQSSNHFFFAANNRRTGEALAHRRAVIRPFSVGLERLRYSDKEGRFTMVRNIHHGEWDGTIGFDFYNGSKDAYNSYYVDKSNYWSRGTRPKRAVLPVEQIALDRTLYRPGQILYFKALLGREGKALADQLVWVKLIDGKNTVLDSVQLSTNEFGSVAGSFRLPDKVGQYQIVAFYLNKAIKKDKGYPSYYWKFKKAKSFSRKVQVAEYRLPTFKVKTVRDTNEYSFGDTIDVAGYALTLADMPLDGAQVYIQCRMQETANSRYVDTTVCCDERGRFVWKWVTPSQHTTPFLNADVTMTVTDINGESQSAHSEYTISNKSLFVEILLNGEVNKDTSDKQMWTIYAENADLVKLAVPLAIRVERMEVPSYYQGQLFPKGARPTVWQHSAEAYAQCFPHQTLNPNFDLVQEWPVTDTMMQLRRVFDARQPLVVDVKNWPVGIYRVTVEGVDKHGEIVRKCRYVQLYDSKATQATLSQPVYVRVPSQVNLGDTLPILVGTSLKDACVYCVAYQGERPIFSKMLPLSTAQQMLYAPTNSKYNVKVRVVAYAVQNGVSYYDIAYQELVMPMWQEPTKELAVKLTHWNRMVEPGWLQEWELEVTDAASSETNAEVVASMVDMAMYELKGEPALEYIGVWHTRYTVPKQKSDAGFMGNIQSYSNHLFNCSMPRALFQYNKEERPEVEFRLPSSHYNNYGGEIVRSTPGRSVSSSLSEVSELTEAVIMYEPPLFILGERMENFPSSVSFAQQEVESSSLKLDDWENNPRQATLHEVEVVDAEINGAQNDFLFNPNISVRNRFEETAFFYPQLRTDSLGRLKFAFSVPDQFTKWHFYATAHTKDLHYGTLSKDIVSRRSLMLQSNCPRFLREGDTLSFAVRVSNVCDTVLVGFAKISFFDPRTNQPLPLLLNAADSLQSFTCNAQGSALLRWAMAVPDGIPVVAYRVLAQSGNYGDGEEKAVPVLSSRQVVAESKSFFVPEDSTEVVVFEKMRDDHSSSRQSLSYSIEVITNPVWTAIAALPYMSYERGNHNALIASALYANALARHLVRNFPQIEMAYTQWAQDTLSQSLVSPLLRNEELKALLLSETPWMRFAASEYQQRLDMANLFKRRRLDNEWKRLLLKLSTNQLPNGGWDWYGRDFASEYITATIVTDYQKLQHIHLDVPEVRMMMRRALTYLDSCASRRYQSYLKNKEGNIKYKYYLSTDDIRYLYARSFDATDTAWRQQPHAQMILSLLLENREVFPYDLQAEVALVLYRLGRQKEARNMVEGMRQQAFVSDQLGMYWRCKSQDATRKVHQQVAMIEAFSEISPNERELERMRQWLLLQKKGNQWLTATATAEAVFALLSDENQEVLDPARTSVTVNQQAFTPASFEPLELGSGRMMKVWLDDDVIPALATVTIRTDEEHPAMGNLFWQYVEQQENIKASGNGLFIERELFHQEILNGQAQLVPVTEEHPAKVGEHLTIRMVLRSTQDLEFVQLYDQRSAALEPLDFMEQNRYSGNLYYCEVPHDASTCFFIKRLPMGTHVLEYEAVVSQTGAFSYGIATAECAYAPEFRAQSQGKRIRCVKNNE